MVNVFFLAGLTFFFCFLVGQRFLKKKTDRYYVLKEILYEILSLEASIKGEKLVINNLQLDRLKLLLNEVLIALSSSKK
jgi:hypothetical protein